MNQEEINRVNKLVEYWGNQKVKLNPGISIDNLKKLESELEFSFEDSFCYYLSKVNGFINCDVDKEMFSFWSDVRMKEENTDNSHPKEVIWFSDYSINLCSFGFHKVNRKVYIHYQTIAGIECVANSFEDFINVYLKDPVLLLR